MPLTWGVYAVIGFVLMGIGYAGGWKARGYEVNTLYKELVAAEATIVAAQAAAEKFQREAQATSARVVTKFVNRIIRVREVAAETPKEIEVIKREAPNCVLPPAFRRLHDAAASAGHSEAVSPGEAAGEAQSVDCVTAARVIAENYGRANEAIAQLEALQEAVAPYVEAQ